MKKTASLSLSKTLAQEAEALPLTRTRAIGLSVQRAAKDPEVLVQALRLRLSRPYEENTIKTTYTCDETTEKALQSLTEMTKLPGEQVVRLSLEAYIHGL